MDTVQGATQILLTLLGVGLVGYFVWMAVRAYFEARQPQKTILGAARVGPGETFRTEE